MPNDNDTDNDHIGRALDSSAATNKALGRRPSEVVTHFTSPPPIKDRVMRPPTQRPSSKRALGLIDDLVRSMGFAFVATALAPKPEWTGEPPHIDAYTVVVWGVDPDTGRHGVWRGLVTYQPDVAGSAARLVLNTGRYTSDRAKAAETFTLACRHNPRSNL